MDRLPVAGIDPRRRALVVDFGLALVAMTLGGLATPGLSIGAGVLACLGCAVAVAALFVAEQTDTLALVDRHSPRSLVVVGVVTFVVALALVVGRLAVPWPSGPLLLGMGAGLGAYRIGYGILEPLPAARLAVAGSAWRRRRGRG